MGASHSENLEKTQLQSALKPNQINYGFLPVHFGNILDITQRCIHSHTHSHTQTHKLTNSDINMCAHACICVCETERERETDRQ